MTSGGKAEGEGPFGALIETRLRLVSWNIWCRFGPWEARRPVIAATLAGVEPDIVGLQEVWSEGDTNQAAVLADQLGFHHAHGLLAEPGY